MRVASCNLCFPCNCFSKSVHAPNVLQLGDEGMQSIDGEKKPSGGDCESDVKKVEQIDIKVSENDSGDARGEVVLKSSFKKPREPGMEVVRKGRVKWMDILGKELVDVHEFEPSEHEDSEGDCGDRSCCACVIL